MKENMSQTLGCFLISRRYTEQMISLLWNILGICLTAVVRCGSTPTIVVTLFAKNEGLMLQYWIEYYSRLFSPQQLIILDNFSSDNLTLALLRNASLSGVKILYDQGQYHRKGHYQMVIAREYFPHADIFLPVDCDEFIVPVDRLGLPYFNLDHIQGHISHFYHNRQTSNISCWGFEQQFDLLSTSLMKSFWQETQYYPLNVSFAMSKKIFQLNDVITVHHGHHQGQLRDGTFCTSSFGRLGIVHYHNRGPMETVARALIDMIGFGYLPANTTIATLPAHRQAIYDIAEEKRPGRHKARELLAYLEKGAAGLLSARRKQATSIQFLSLHDLVYSSHH